MLENSIFSRKWSGGIAMFVRELLDLGGPVDNTQNQDFW